MAEIKTIVRIAGFDLDGTKPIWYALTGIKGVGINFGRMVSKVVAERYNVTPQTPLGALPEEAFEFIEEVIRNPVKYGIPKWAVNVPKDIWTGEYRHLVGSDLETYNVAVRKLLYSIGSWRGIRLAKGLRVRGQRTKSHPRKNKISVVGRKKKQQKA